MNVPQKVDNMVNDSLKSFDSYQNDSGISLENVVPIVIPVIYAFIVFIGISGNTLVIIVVTLNHQMRNSTNALIVNLAAADLLFLTFCVPFTAADFLQPDYPYPNWWCSCLYYLQFVTAYASVWTLVLMSLDRFLAVVFPVQSLTLRTSKNSILASLVVWIVILLFNVNQLWKHGVYDVEESIDEKRHICGYIAMTNATGTEYDIRVHFFTYTVLGYIIPLAVTCCLYCLMLHKLWFRMPGARKTLKSRAVSGESLRAKRKVTWMVSGVIVCFAICWLPLNGCFVYTALTYRPKIGPPYSKAFFIVMVCSQSFAYTNSCLNPILYAFLSENFRKGFSHIIKCCTSVTSRQTSFKALRQRLADSDVEKTEACTYNNNNNSVQKAQNVTLFDRKHDSTRDDRSIVILRVKSTHDNLTRSDLILDDRMEISVLNARNQDNDEFFNENDSML